MATFSLIEEAFIPVRPAGGGPVREVGLREALTRASEFERIDDPSPLITVALYRLCLAVLHRALRGPTDAEQAATWYVGGFPEGQVEAYLAEHAARFDLFHPVQPFMQVADLTLELEGGKYLSHWTRLGAEVGSANTTALFNTAARPNGERRDAISPAEAARRLLEHQTFALGGLIKRFTTSARAAPVATLALTVPQGRTLHETFCLNLVPYQSEGDRPAWEQAPPSVAQLQALYDPEQARVATGLTDHYSWLSRSVRLEPELDEQSRVIVRFIGFAAGVPFKNTLEDTGKTVDPMVATTPSRDPKQSVPFAQKLRREQLFWRDVLALLPEPQNRQQVLGGKGNGKLIRVKGAPPRAVDHARTVLRALEAQRREAGPFGGEVNLDAMMSDDPSPAVSVYQPAIPVSVFGQVTDQGKAFAFRQEGYTLPHAYIEDAQKFTDEVYTALQDATNAGDGLRQAIRKLAAETLSRGGDRDAHKDDVSKLMGQLPAEATYWARLEAPFRQYLAELDDPERATLNWRRALRRTAWDAWELALLGVGDGAAALRAASLAGGILVAALKPLEPQQPQGSMT